MWANGSLGNGIGETLVVMVTAHLLHVRAETLQSLALVRFKPPAISELGLVTINWDVGSSHSVCHNRRPNAPPASQSSQRHTNRASTLFTGSSREAGHS